MAAKNRLIKILTGILIALVLIVTAAGYYFSGLVITPKTRDYGETYNIEVEKGKLVPERFNKLVREEVYIDSPYGYKIHGLYFPVKNTRKVMIFTHGVVYTLYGSVKFMDMFLKRGFNVLIYDNRYHGKSGGKNTTFGYYEKYDLKAIVDWVIARNGKNQVIGLHGESMGAAITLQYAAVDDRASFFISDCSLSSLPDLLKLRLKKDFNLPAFPLYHAASLISKIRGGMFFHEIAPVRDIPNVHKPVLFIHGKTDTYIPHEMTVALYESKPGAKGIFLPENAGHAEAFWNHRARYEAAVDSLLRKYGFL